MNVEPITVSTEVTAPIAKVWETWTSTEHITQWCSASDDWHVPKATNDLRLGGTFMTRMEAKDGSFGFDFGGVYTAVENHRHIAYEMADGRKVAINFERHGERTKITETFDPESQNPLEMQRGGWQAILDNFKKYTETH